MKLIGKKLTLIDITRKSLFDADYIGCCDNCGKVISNIATVKDENGKIYEIGLDCKKTLIDKPKIAEMLNTKEFMIEYKVKDLKQETSEAEKFLKFCSYPEIDIDVCKYSNTIDIRDRKPHKYFAELTGNIIYSQNIGYLYKIGLKPFIDKLISSNKVSINS